MFGIKHVSGGRRILKRWLRRAIEGKQRVKESKETKNGGRVTEGNNLYPGKKESTRVGKRKEKGKLATAGQREKKDKGWKT